MVLAQVSKARAPSVRKLDSERSKMGELNEKTVTAVVVTYGERKGLIGEILEALKTLGVMRVVVVDNGSGWNVKSELSREHPGLADVVELGANTGSAAGFSSGIQRALELRAEYVWLLDDDTRPHRDTLSKLIGAYSEAAECTPRDRLAVVAFRPAHQADVARGVSVHRINPRPNSVLGFHILDVPYKIWRRTSWGRPRLKSALPTKVALDAAPYGGLLFHSDLISAIGLPNRDFVLYADDVEFTSRITKWGGRIVLATEARLDDLESSWLIKDRFENSFSGWLRGKGEFRAYYGMRNQVYVDKLNSKGNPIVFWLNCTIYMAILFVMSRLQHQSERYHLLRGAVADALAGRLGWDVRFPLPGGAESRSGPR